LTRLAKASALLAGIGAAGGIAAAGTGAATASVMSLVGAVASLAGLAPVAVGGLAAYGAVVGTVRLGLMGLDEAFKNLDDPKKFAEALKDASPAGREFATTVRDLKPAFDGVRLDVQQRLLAGYGAETRTLAERLLPSLRTGLGGTASELNLTGKELIRFASSGSTVRDVDTIFRNTNKTLAAGRPIVTNLAAALVDVGVVGSSVMPELASGATEATGRFREWIAEARQSGQLEQWIRGGIDTLQQLGRIAGNVGGSLGAIFTAAKASGADFLSTAERVTAEVERLLESAEGQDALIAFFRESRDTIDALLPGLQSAGRFALDFLSSFSDTGGLQSAAGAVTDLLEAVEPLGSGVGELAGDTLRGLAAGGSAVAAGLSPAVSVVTALLDSLGPVPAIALATIAAFKGFGIAGAGVAALGTSVAGLAGRLGASEAAGNRITRVFDRMGSTLPIVGAAVVAVAALIDTATADTEDWATALGKGQISLAQLNQEITAHNERVGWLREYIPGWKADIASVTAELEGQIGTMGPLEAAQTRVALAQARYDEALRVT
jgi:hypothetical protein